MLDVTMKERNQKCVLRNVSGNEEEARKKEEEEEAAIQRQRLEKGRIETRNKLRREEF